MGSARGAEISRIIASHAPSVMCLTELTLGMLPKDGHVLLPEGSSGYPGPANRRKVALWSSAPWTEPDLIGHPDLPGGRFVSGVTHGTKVLVAVLSLDDGVFRVVTFAQFSATGGQSRSVRFPEHRTDLGRDGGIRSLLTHG